MHVGITKIFQLFECTNYILMLIPAVDVGETGPTQSIPMWYIRDFTGIGYSSGCSTLSYLFIRWQLGQYFTCIIIIIIIMDRVPIRCHGYIQKCS